MFDLSDLTDVVDGLNNAVSGVVDAATGSSSSTDVILYDEPAEDDETDAATVCDINDARGATRAWPRS